MSNTFLYFDLIFDELRKEVRCRPDHACASNHVAAGKTNLRPHGGIRIFGRARMAGG